MNVARGAELSDAAESSKREKADDVFSRGSSEAPGYDLEAIRAEFPILDQEVNGHPLSYLDNAASSQKPSCVIEAMADFYESDYSNVHRGVHSLSERATRLHEGAREKVRGFIGAERVEEIIFTRGTTDGVNLVAQAFARPRLGPGDEVLITGLEHHSNIVPWQIVCEQTGAKLVVVRITDSGEVTLEDFVARLNKQTKMVAFSHTSNALGTVLPAKEMIAAAKERDIPVLVDGAQAVPHLPVDVRSLGADFFAFSGHKVYGPSGIGVLYGLHDRLEAMPPYQGGGDMIRTVTFEKTEFNDLPYKFEAGTPFIEGAIGLGVALDFVERIGIEAIARHEHALLQATQERLRSIDAVRFVGTAPERAAVVSFVVDGIHPHDLGTILDQRGVAIRAGHHCAQPVMDRFGVPATARASYACYNSHEEVERLGQAVEFGLEVFG